MVANRLAITTINDWKITFMQNLTKLHNTFNNLQKRATS